MKGYNGVNQINIFKTLLDSFVHSFGTEGKVADFV